VALQAKSGPGLLFLGFLNNNLFYRAGLLVQRPTPNLEYQRPTPNLEYQHPTPNLEYQVSVFMTPRYRVAQLYPQTLGTHFSRLLRHAWVTVGLFFNPGHHTGIKSNTKSNPNPYHKEGNILGWRTGLWSIEVKEWGKHRREECTKKNCSSFFRNFLCPLAVI
jgi:hypothetical protein